MDEKQEKIDKKTFEKLLNQRRVINTVEKQRRFKGEIDRFEEKWPEILENGDPFYNPNLTLDREDFSLR